MGMVTRREAIRFLTVTGAAACALAGCAKQDEGTTQGESASQNGAATKTDASGSRRLRILATSDMHGMFVPWDYILDEEDTSGSVAQVAAAIKELRDENTLLVDAGDTIQDNSAELFLQDSVHPMIVCMNSLGYDVGVTGNHEYNFGMDVVRKTVASFEGTVLTGNVIDEHGDPIAEGSTIINKNGVRVGFIGMVTPKITRWDAANLAGCTVTNPVDETRKLIEKIKDDVDVLIGVMHMDLEGEVGFEKSGAKDMAEACPEFDLIVAAHGHKLVEGEKINDVLVVENKYHGQTLAVVDLMLEPDGDGWKVVDRISSPVETASYTPDPDIVEMMAEYDDRAKTYARTVIGELEDGPLTPENEIAAIPQAVLEDTPLLDLIHTVQLHYTGADVSVTALLSPTAHLDPGPIRRCDVSSVYKFSNTLYTLAMTGAQLRTYMDRSVEFYKQFHKGDLTIAFNPDLPLYLFDTFQGVTYKVNVAKDPGKRIEDLAWPDGSPVKDDDKFVLVANNYRATSSLLVPGNVFEEGDELPALIEDDVNSSIGDVRDMIADYIANVKGGVIKPEVDKNWSIVGNDWDSDEHKRAVELIAEGKLSVAIDDQKRLTDIVITQDDLAKASES